MLLVLVLFLLAFCACAQADTEIALEPCAGKMSINEDNFILLTPGNLSDHPDLVSSLGMSQEELLQDWEARGVQFQAWTKKMDSCLLIWIRRPAKSKKNISIFIKVPAGSPRTVSPF